ncbi:MAG: M1 family aminopeptidase [Vicinamibacterales bacterium]
MLERGISRELAARRASNIRDLTCAVHLALPAGPDDPISGHIELAFLLTDTSTPLVLDFDPDAAGTVHEVAINGARIAPLIGHGHIVIAAAALQPGRQIVRIAFTAGNGPLNRRTDHLYTIFVPARAHEALPCFDQPDIKARWTLSLDLPEGWTAVSNAALRIAQPQPDFPVERRQRLVFAETRPLPTYLFAFAAGAFQVDTAMRGERTMRLFHIGADEMLVSASRDTIFDGHAEALTWMEDYTAIPYPFDTFDIVLLPAFQFTGMEHPGALFYGASALLLHQGATRQQQLARAHVIAHETAHLWFGDLVTMTWFDDVWMKEVLANLMAARIVNPQFPEIDHDLRFLHAHYPGAYDVDRTAGTHPIRQPLDNLRDAASLYGAIVYLKSPIVFRQLELQMGEERLRTALRRYLTRYAYGNAAWPDLVELIRTQGFDDAERWNRLWIEEAGRPGTPCGARRQRRCGGVVHTAQRSATEHSKPTDVEHTQRRRSPRRRRYRCHASRITSRSRRRARAAAVSGRRTRRSDRTDPDLDRQRHRRRHRARGSIGAGLRAAERRWARLRRAPSRRAEPSMAAHASAATA